MAVSDTVSVWSKSERGEVVLWQYDHGQSTAELRAGSGAELAKILRTYSLELITTGTVVVCELRQEILDRYWVRENEVRRSVIQYAGILPIPVYYNSDQISCKYAAWDNPTVATEADWSEAIREMHGEDALLVIPIFSPPDELDVQGVVWMPERTSYFSRAKLDIYVKRMFIMRDDGLVIPKWAAFISGMINSNKMQRIVSGNTVKDDLIARKTSELIKNRIIEEFKKLRNKPEHVYWKIVGPHDDAIKGSAADYPDFMDCVWDRLRFPAKGRKLTVLEYLAYISHLENRIKGQR